MVEFTENPRWFEVEKGRLSGGLEEAVFVPFQHLYQSLGAHNTSGNDWTEQFPEEMFRVSSDPEKKEYPQMQTGSLRESVSFERAGDLEFQVGFFGESQVKLMYLEFGRTKVSDSGRRVSPFDYGPLYMTFEGVDSDDVLGSMRNELVSFLGSR